MRKPYILSFFLFLVFACQQTSSPSGTYKIKFSGKTMGTYYVVTYLDEQNRNFQKEIDQLLEDINMDVSTYIQESFISRLNQSKQGLILDESAYPHFTKVLKASKEIFEKTDGTFDPTVMPLVNYWGFGTTGKKAVTAIDSQKVETLRSFVGLDKLQSKFNGSGNSLLEKSKPELQIDFSAIAKGYAVDAVGVLLEENGVKNYLVDIGGENRALGKNEKELYWRTGINTPKEDAAVTDIEKIVSLENKSVATSGNYRIYYEVDGRKYGHELDPRTGYSVQTNLLSVSVFSDNCMTADAYATAFMIMGMEASEKLIAANDDLDAIFIYGTADGGMAVKATDGIKAAVLK